MSAPLGLTYNGLVTQVALLAPYQVQTVSGVVQGVAPEFTALIPQMLQYAEQRIQRDVELLATQVFRYGFTLDPTTDQLLVPNDQLVTIQDVLVFSDGAWAPPLNPVSKSYLLTVWPYSSPRGPPRVFAVQGGDYQTLTNTVLLFGPPPDQAYPVILIGDTRDLSLAVFADPPYAATSTTWISTWLPDLLVIACMIYVSAYQRDFGRQSDDPQMAQSYEAQYQALLASVDKEEFRKRFQADAWSSQPTPPAATPTR